MKRILTTTLLVALLSVAGVFAWSANSTSQAHESEEAHSHEEQEEQPSQEASNIYSYVAQPGDSYSLMARKAVQTYGLKNEVALSEAAILYAEANLAKQAGEPQLEVGQHVEITEATVADWVELAQKLSESELANWKYYTQFANFNTDAVGQEN